MRSMEQFVLSKRIRFDKAYCVVFAEKFIFWLEYDSIFI